MYTVDSCPHFMCWDCKFFRNDADRAESLCPRLNHKNLKWAKPWFKSYDCGEHHIICNAFKPKHPEYADFKDWTNFDDYWAIYQKAWLPKALKYSTVSFILNDDFEVRYKVPLQLFIDGTHIIDGVLQATEKNYYKRCKKSDEHPTGYVLVREKINGVML